jgi:putative intracellular protease/amidase
MMHDTQPARDSGNDPVVIALADGDFDPTEVAVPWHTLRQAGFQVTFATARGTPAACDPLVLAGPFFGRLGATPANVALYRSLEADPAFRSPDRFDAINPQSIAALILPGGHAPGMRQYLEDVDLQAAVLRCFQANRLVGAICHGPVVLARTVDPATGHSVIHGRHVTALTKRLERLAYYLTFWRLGTYYRTYPAYVEDEITAVLADPAHFDRGPWMPSYDRPCVVQDGNLITARWPGDAQGFADALVVALRTGTCRRAGAILEVEKQ